MIIIDNCISDINCFRERALSLTYTKSGEGNGWKGYRCLTESDVSSELISLISEKLCERDTMFIDANYRCYFHYSLEEDNLNTNKIHKDSNSDYAGVLYMTPNPIPNSGTSIYNDLGEVIEEFDNIYNRLIIYSANEWHSVNKCFGEDAKSGRLTFTIFCNLKQKNTNSII